MGTPEAIGLVAVIGGLIIIVGMLAFGTLHQGRAIAALIDLLGRRL
jgi:hypothetical protein